MAHEERDLPDGEIPAAGAAADEVQTLKRRAVAKRQAAVEARSATKQELLASLTAKQEGKLTDEEITTLNVRIQSLAIARSSFDFSFLDADSRDPWVMFDSDAADGIITLPPERL